MPPENPTLQSSIVMSPAERSRTAILVVEPDPLERNNLRTTLKSLGLGTIGDAPNHATALERLAERKFTHIIFDAKKSNYPVKDWLVKVLEGGPETICIPTSSDPSVDDVFDLLVVGARGYLVKPFTVDSVDQAILMATKGEPIADAVLQAKDRNEALVAILLSSLDKTATTLRQAEKFETAKREVPRLMAIFRRSSDLALTFSKGGVDGLLEALERFCIERSKGPATRLGRLRKRLSTGRTTEDQPGQ